MSKNKEILQRIINRITENRILLEDSLPELSQNEIDLYGADLYYNRRQNLELLKEEIEYLSVLING